MQGDDCLTACITRSSPVVLSPRVQQLCGLFDVPVTERTSVAWDISLPLNAHPWNVGLIVGPSGCGKSTIAKELFGESLIAGFNWHATHSLVDAFPDAMSIKEITGLLSSVGFSSPPAWLRPFGCLSNGEQFRVTIARALAESPELAVIDEFTSVVDRTVAKVGSYAVAKTVRRRNQKLIAVTCHYDVMDWLDPDWTYDPATGEFRWRLERRQRPPITLDVRRVTRDAWRVFKQHHYLSADIIPGAQVYVGLVEQRPAVLTAVCHFPHPTASSWREHRTVCLPDFQGCGIGNAMSEYIASAYAASDKCYTSTTSHPAMIWHRAKSSLWDMFRIPRRSNTCRGGSAVTKGMQKSIASNRLVASFRYVGPSSTEAAEKLGLNWGGGKEAKATAGRNWTSKFRRRFQLPAKRPGRKRVAHVGDVQDSSQLDDAKNATKRQVVGNLNAKRAAKRPANRKARP